ncbi:PrsW family glutamic-type intramembrane protease [Spirosoma panaciterrae]|uniref:PrsW family glutamic-type intramembrane protease n=1 Tax=Spirosoma panaciterrae TaxID=496058 RepID=UPI00037C2F4A|nr:PrsW family glutamic-type intramembrane protease [Spirosoma panaciterrae]
MQPPTNNFQSPYVFYCLAGPDSGKSIALPISKQLSLGRSPQNDVVLSDPYVVDFQLVIGLVGNQLSFSTYEGNYVYMGSQLTPSGLLYTEGNSDLQIGQSLWRFSRQAVPVQPLSQLGRMKEWLGLQHLESDFKLSSIFSAVWEKRSDEDIETAFTVGSIQTTPPVQTLSSTWPKPWLFARIGLFALIVFIGLYICVSSFNNPILIPGLLVTGSLAVPMTCLLFFWEMNVPQNISIYQTLKLVLSGGIASLLISLLLFSNTGFLTTTIGPPSAGIIEESGKLLAVLLLMRNKIRYSWTLNGLLLGAAVGTGFAAFESAGYAFIQLFEQGGSPIQNIVLRGIMAPFAHTIWTAIAVAAVWRLKGSQPFDWSLLTNKAFLRLFAVPVVLHMLWNMNIQLPLVPYILDFFPTKFILLGLMGWTVIFSLIQEGLKQVQDAQKRSLQ